MKTVQGDLIQMLKDGVFDVMVHGCNCHHDMSGGVALQIKNEFPKARFIDWTTPYGDESKLGQISFITVQIEQGPRTIINAYTQFFPGADARLEAIRESFKTIKETGLFDKLRIGVPQIGCGIGGLTWDQVSPVIDEAGLDITVVEYVPS